MRGFGVMGGIRSPAVRESAVSRQVVGRLSMGRGHGRSLTPRRRLVMHERRIGLVRRGVEERDDAERRAHGEERRGGDGE